jgi:hypothetical protein
VLFPTQAYNQSGLPFSSLLFSSPDPLSKSFYPTRSIHIFVRNVSSPREPFVSLSMLHGLGDAGDQEDVVEEKDELTDEDIEAIYELVEQVKNDENGKGAI